jgi:transcriptional regulator with XRE-family HTH domain
MKIIDEFIKEVRKFGQKKASRLSGVPFETINNWCTGECIPRLDKAQKVADAMGLEFLLFDKE